MYQHLQRPPIHGVIFLRERPLRTRRALCALAFPPESHSGDYKMYEWLHAYMELKPPEVKQSIFITGSHN